MKNNAITGLNFKDSLEYLYCLCLEINTAAGMNNYARRDEYVDELIAYLNRVASAELFRHLSLSIMYMLTNGAITCSMLDLYVLFENLRNCQDINVLKSCVIQFLIEKLHISEQSIESKNEIVNNIKSYVKENISNPELSLKLIADTHLHMNVDYVSKLFYKETGIKFTTYLNSIRVQKAQELMITGKVEKLASLAEAVGLGASPNYFSRLFKEQTGMSPSVYAKLFTQKLNYIK